MTDHKFSRHFMRTIIIELSADFHHHNHSLYGSHVSENFEKCVNILLMYCFLRAKCREKWKKKKSATRYIVQMFNASVDDLILEK